MATATAIRNSNSLSSIQNPSSQFPVPSSEFPESSCQFPAPPLSNVHRGGLCLDRIGIRTKKPFAVEMDDVLGVFGNPDFRFP